MKNLLNNSFKFAALLYIIMCNGASANAQIKSLEEALQPWKLIHTNRPSNSWGEDGIVGMFRYACNCGWCGRGGVVADDACCCVVICVCCDDCV